MRFQHENATSGRPASSGGAVGLLRFRATETGKKEKKMDNALSLPRPGRCKWAEGDSGNYTFPCNVRVESGTSYCTDHRALVYMPPEERRRSRSASAPAFKRIAA